MKLVPITITFSLLLSISTLPAALSLQTYSATAHHRFANDPAFIGADYDWSGIARASNGRWVTMISATHFISTNHAAPGVGNSVVFHEDNDPGGTTITRTVDSRTRVGGTDLVIGQLSSAPGPTIAIYGIASNLTSTATFGSSAYNDREAFVVGLNNTGSGTQSFRVGRNELDGFYDSVSVLGTSTVSGSLTGVGASINFDDDRGTPQSLGADEAYLQGGDSGGPLFVIQDDELILTGINWFIDSGSPRYSGTTFVPSYIADIEALIDGESLTLVAVPEPSSSLLLALGSITLIRRRR